MKKTQLFLPFFAMLATSVFSQWTIPNPDFLEVRMDDVYFIHPDTGWVAAASRIHKTTDGGLTWTSQFFQPGYYFRSVEFLDGQRGFAGTLDSVFLRTLDGGETWEDMALNMIPKPPGICGISHVGDLIYASGLWNTPAYLYKSPDAGDTWEFIDLSDHGIAMVDVHFSSPDTGFVTGQDANGGAILFTNDGGDSWEKVYSSNVEYEFVWKIQRVTADTLVASTEHFGTTPARILVSYDGGQNWEGKNVPTSNNQMQGIGFLTGQHGWVGGYSQNISETFDGGDTWESLDIGFDINRFFIYSENLVYASGSSVYKYGEEPISSTYDRTHVDIRPNFSVRQSADGLFEVEVELESTDNVDLQLYTLEGRRAKSIFRGRLAAGKHVFQQNEFLPSGVYLLGLQVNRGMFSEKIIVN